MENIKRILRVCVFDKKQFVIYSKSTKKIIDSIKI